MGLVGVCVGVCVGVYGHVWAAGEGVAPDETQPATRAKRAETDKSDGAPRSAQSRSVKSENSGSLPADLAEPRLGPWPSPKLAKIRPRHSDTPHPLSLSVLSLLSVCDSDIASSRVSAPRAAHSRLLARLLDSAPYPPDPLLPSSLVSHDLRLAGLPSGSHAHTLLPFPCRQLKLSVISPISRPGARFIVGIPGEIHPRIDLAYVNCYA
jgi:hypothetical protein